MKRKQIKKCQRVLKRQTYSASHPNVPWRVKCGWVSSIDELQSTPMKVREKKYLVNNQEVSEEEFKQTLIASRPCEQSLACVFAGFSGTINGTRFQIVYPC